MPSLRLTSKLLSGIDDAPSPDETVLSPLGDWYGHIFTIDRRKCILFINEPTLFVSMTCWVVKSHYRQIVPFFLEMLTLNLRTHFFRDDEIAFILAQHRNMGVGRAQDRTMIGSLNNRIADAKTMIAWQGGFGVCDWQEINFSLNKTPMKPIGYRFGLEQMRALVAREITGRAQ